MLSNSLGKLILISYILHLLHSSLRSQFNPLSRIPGTYHHSNVAEIKVLLTNITFYSTYVVGADKVKNNLLGWELLRSIQEESSDWSGVEISCRKSLAILSNDNSCTIPSGEDPQAYETKLKLTQARALVHMGHKNHLKQAVNMLEEVSRCVRNKMQRLVCHHYIPVHGISVSGVSLFY